MRELADATSDVRRRDSTLEVALYHTLERLPMKEMIAWKTMQLGWRSHHFFLPLLALALGSSACSPRVPPVSDAKPKDQASLADQSGSAPLWSKAAPHATRIADGQYIVPPRAVIDLLESEAPPKALLHAKSRRLVRLYEQQLIPLSQKSRPSLGLAGVRIDSGNLRRLDTPLYTRFDLQSARDISRKDASKKPSSRQRRPAPRVVLPPEGALFGELLFSPDGNHLAVTLVYEDQVDLGVYDWKEGRLESLHVGPLNSFWSPPCSWLDNNELICSRALHTGAPPELAEGPKIRELGRGAAPALAYSNLLRDTNDDALFEHYGSVALVRVKLDGETSEPLPATGLLVDYSLSPDRKYLLSTPLTRPYSRLYPADRTQRNLVIHDLSSMEVVLRVGPSFKLVSGTSLPIGPRLARWDPQTPATLSYVDRGRDSAGLVRDSLVQRSAPFTKGRQVIASELRRVSDFGWTSKGTLFITDSGTGSSGSPGWTAYRLFDGQREFLASGGKDRVGDPSQALRVNGGDGPVFESSGKLFFAGKELSHQGARPRLLSYDLKSARTEILWRSGTSEHAEVFAVLDPHRPTYLVRAETPQMPPSFSLTGAGPRRRLTKIPAPYEALSGVRQHLIRYRRADGVMLSAMLYLPRHFRSGHPVPTVFWIYPREFGDAAEASLSTEEPFRYFRVKGPSRFSVLTQGYALLDAPSMPIIGKIRSGSNDFLPQLKQSAEAAIDHLVRLGVSDRKKIAVMGRSYGAFATANLMAHTSLFQTGIAVSGAYNRTLTPFGFQKETRTFWQNTEAYVNMSPFFFADQMTGSLLLIHGEDDENPGTPVLQSERFYAALVGNGVPSRYVAFPFEGHRFRGRQAVLHTAAEIIRWLDTHLKGEKGQ